MASFKDRTGYDWTLRPITIGFMPKLRAAGFDLNADDPMASVKEPEAFGRVMWLFCEHQASPAGVSAEEFADRFDGPTIFAAVEAVAAAVADFTHPPAVAEELRKKLPETRRADEERRALAIRSGSNGSAGSSPASPASTPANSPAANSSGSPTDASVPTGCGEPD